MKSIILATAGLVVVKKNKLLLAYSKNKNAWYLPGGKIDNGEDSVSCLKREVLEELNIDLDMNRLDYYCHISAPAYGEFSNIIMEQDCFLYELNEKIEPGNEIEKVKFFDKKMYQSESAQVAGVLQIFEILTNDQILF